MLIVVKYINFQHTNVVTFTRPGWHVVCDLKIVPLDQNTRLFSINICEGTKEMRIQLTRPLLPLPWEIRDVEMQMTPKVVKLQLSLVSVEHPSDDATTVEPNFIVTPHEITSVRFQMMNGTLAQLLNQD